MTEKQVIKTIIDKRTCGIVNAFIFNISEKELWKEILYKKLENKILYENLSLNDFKEKLIRIKKKHIAESILTQLLNKDMAYGGEIMPLNEAKSIANSFVNLFEVDSEYYSNSNWNMHRPENDGAFEFGLKCREFLTNSTFDSGLIIIDKYKIGMIWFEDED